MKRHNLTKPLVLVGMMGSGKSTVGRRLARKLNLQFYDSDKVIEGQEGLPIVDIVEFKGEPYLRRKEHEVITDILRYGAVVLSTGGNSFVDPVVRKLITDVGVAIWLQADFDTLYERIARRNTRPEFNGTDQHAVLEKMMQERQEIYTTAPIQVESGKEDVGCLVDKIIVKLEAYLGQQL